MSVGTLFGERGAVRCCASCVASFLDEDEDADWLVEEQAVELADAVYAFWLPDTVLREWVEASRDRDGEIDGCTTGGCDHWASGSLRAGDDREARFCHCCLARVLGWAPEAVPEHRPTLVLLKDGDTIESMLLWMPDRVLEAVRVREAVDQALTRARLREQWQDELTRH